MDSPLGPPFFVKKSAAAYNAWTGLTYELGFLARPTHVEVPGGAVTASSVKAWIVRAKAARAAFDAAIALTIRESFQKAPPNTRVSPQAAIQGIEEPPPWHPPETCKQHVWGMNAAKVVHCVTCGIDAPEAVRNSYLNPE